MIRLRVTSPSISGSTIHIGQVGTVTIRGRNDMTDKQQLGCSWVIQDPDGEVVEKHPGGVTIDWEFGYTGPGDEQDFVGDRFDFNKAGSYKIKAELFMNPFSPVTVDSYDGPLCTVSGEPAPGYELVQHTIYPFAYIYDGDAERCIFKFTLTPEQMPGTEWMRDRIVDAFVNKLKEQDSRLLELKVYQDTTPALWTDYLVEVTATASPIAWGVVIYAVLAILFVVAIAFAIMTVDKVFFHRNPELHDVKPAWDKETLIMTIGDAEEYWDRPITPTDTLNAMSEAELRGLLDGIAEEEVPPGVSWWPFVVIGGGVLALALATKRLRQPKPTS